MKRQVGNGKLRMCLKQGCVLSWSLKNTQDQIWKDSLYVAGCQVVEHGCVRVHSSHMHTPVHLG